jgi:aerobic carbon-monoxide dehydrogenase small subunit
VSRETGIHTVTIHCVINGEPRVIDVPPMARLLDVLREELRLTGTKEGCGEGECGACSVLIDGELANSCLVPVMQVDGARITTIEGVATLAAASAISVDTARIQQAFIDEGGAQCGICTPGMILATISLLHRHPHPTMDQIREGLAGNLCRCTGYMRIFEAVRKAASADPVGAPGNTTGRPPGEATK